MWSSAEFSVRQGILPRLTPDMSKEVSVKHIVTSIAASIILPASTFVPVTGHAASAPSTPKMSVTIVSVKPTTVTGKNATVTFHLRVKGIVLDAMYIGKANVRGHGHIQLYVDSIPKDAYVRKDLKQHWLASLAATTLSLNLSPALVGGRGKHRIIVALAQNNSVLYHVPPASTTITVK
jgi:hypothetical protein